MTTIDPQLIETLLYMSESDVLDFKRDQYPLAGATDEQKSEFVKDVVAFANAWKTADAHIVIGADENPGGRAMVVGVGQHLNDADLQQLVTTKTNVPVAFEYIPVTVDGKPMAIVRIRAEQQRPIFLRKAFGRLKPNIVYVRRGSSTAEASPDEIARMGASAATAAQEPLLAVELADPIDRRPLGASTTLVSTVLRERPPPPPEMDALLSRTLGITAQLQRSFSIPHAVALGTRGPDPEKLVAYRRKMALLKPVGFRAENVGRVLVEDARIVLEVPKMDDLQVIDELPEKPRGPLEIPRFGAFNIRPPKRWTRVTDLGDRWEITAALGKIQPTATEWSAPLWIGSAVARDLTLKARVLGDNLPKAIEVTVALKIEVQEDFLDDEVLDEADEETDD